MESAGNSNQKGDKEMAGQNPGVDGQLDRAGSRCTVNRSGPGPGQGTRGKRQESLRIRTLLGTDAKTEVFKGVY